MDLYHNAINVIVLSNMKYIDNTNDNLYYCIRMYLTQNEKWF